SPPGCGRGPARRPAVAGAAAVDRIRAPDQPPRPSSSLPPSVRDDGLRRMTNHTFPGDSCIVGTVGATITIGVPVVTGERYLAEALAALREQTLTDIEVVIADNASTDRTAEIAREVARADRRFHYVRRERNLGLVENYNRVFAETSGEFFAWHAADDRAH